MAQSNAAPAILYSDEDVIVAVKPSGLDSQSASGDANMVFHLSLMLGGQVFPVHRLDRETSGVMVYARSRDAAAALSGALLHEQIKKCYLAVLLGSLPEPAGEYRDLLYHDAKRNKSYVVTCARRGVREAALSYRTAGEASGVTLAAIRLLTGRTHQIRVQFASRGNPVLGDRRYGGKPDEARWGDGIPECGRGIALYCARLSFPHPKTGADVSFESLPSGSPWDLFDIGAVAALFTEMM